MSSTEDRPSKSGIVTDEHGQRHIPSSVRADGTKRKEIKIRPGYRPPEDVEVYRNRTAEAYKTRGKGGVPGADTSMAEDKAGSAASNKNAKRREARKKAKAAADDTTAEPEVEVSTEGARRQSDSLQNESFDLTKEQSTVGEKTPENFEAEKEKKVRKLHKKLREARDLQQKKERGEGLLPEQLQKAIRIKELIRELEQLGVSATE